MTKNRKKEHPHEKPFVRINSVPNTNALEFDLLFRNEPYEDRQRGKRRASLECRRRKLDDLPGIPARSESNRSASSHRFSSWNTRLCSLRSWRKYRARPDRRQRRDLWMSPVQCFSFHGITFNDRLYPSPCKYKKWSLTITRYAHAFYWKISYFYSKTIVHIKGWIPCVQSFAGKNSVKFYRPRAFFYAPIVQISIATYESPFSSRLQCPPENIDDPAMKTLR